MANSNQEEKINEEQGGGAMKEKVKKVNGLYLLFKCAVGATIVTATVAYLGFMGLSYSLEKERRENILRERERYQDYRRELITRVNNLLDVNRDGRYSLDEVYQFYLKKGFDSKNFEAYPNFDRFSNSELETLVSSK